MALNETGVCPRGDNLIEIIEADAADRCSVSLVDISVAVTRKACEI